MIFTIFVSLTLLVLGAVFNVLPSIPAIPATIDTTVNRVLDFIFSSFDLVSVFIRPGTFVLVGTCILVLLNFDVIYHFVMFIISKIPFLKNWG